MRKGLTSLKIILIAALFVAAIGVAMHCDTYAATYVVPDQYLSKVQNQGNRPWCNQYAVCSAVEAQMRMEGIDVPEGGFDQGLLYRQCAEVDQLENATYLSTTLKVAQETGLKAINCTMRYKIASYTEITSGAIKSSLDSGHIVLMACYVDAQWGSCDIIDDLNNTHTGAHTTYLIGYVDDIDIGVNSWGYDDTSKGRFRVSQDYINRNLISLWIFDLETDRNR